MGDDSPNLIQCIMNVWWQKPYHITTSPPPFNISQFIFCRQDGGLPWSRATRRRLVKLNFALKWLVLTCGQDGGGTGSALRNTGNTPLLYPAVRRLRESVQLAAATILCHCRRLSVGGGNYEHSRSRFGKPTAK